MFYRIGEITIDAAFRMPSFETFTCEPVQADVILTQDEKLPALGRKFDAGALYIYRISEGWFFQAARQEGAGLIVSEDYTRLCLAGDDSSLLKLGMLVEWLIRAALECLLIRRGYISLHAAAVAVDGKAYAFTGPSGVGKSTRAGAWEEAFGARLISGDRPLINVSAMELCGVPWDGKEKCYRNEAYPLQMICEIRRAERVYVREMNFDQRRRLLLQQSFVPMWDTETSAIQMANIAKLAGSARIVRMFGGPLPEDAKIMREKLERNESEKEEPDMKAKSGFLLKNVVGENILMPVGDNVGQFSASVILNGAAALVWEKLQNPVSRNDLLAAILDEYDIDEATAAKDLDAFLAKLKEFGVLDD